MKVDVPRFAKMVSFWDPRQHITLMLWVYERIKFWLRMDRIENSKTFLRHAHGLPMQGRWQEVADKQSCPQLFCLQEATVEHVCVCASK